MSEDSSTPEFPALEADASQKAPRKKKAATKPPAKSTEPAKPADQVEAKPQKSEGKPSTDAVDSPTEESSPRPIKRGVRVVKKAASKKASAKKASKNTTSQESDAKSDQAKEKKTDASAQGATEVASGDESAKSQQQQRRGRGRNRGRQQGQGEQQQEAPKAKIDIKTVAARAWKIFVGEVNEEGLALIADKDAREMARRSLRIAEIYTREEAIQLQKGKKSAKKGKAEPKAPEESKAEPQD